MKGHASRFERMVNQASRHIWIIGIFLFLFVFIKNAWVTEDAYILFRSIAQLFAGHGPVWNPNERVQVFTSPLWYGILSFVRLLSSDFYLNVIIVSLVLCLGTLYILKKTVKDPFQCFCIIAILVSSKGFADFTSSGLETPLAYFLLMVFLYEYQKIWLSKEGDENVPLHFGRLMLSFGLLLVCRHDLATLVSLPVLGIYFSCRSMTWKMKGWKVAVGISPFIVWSLFSLIYYGFPFPNTAYAKLHTGIPQIEIWEQGAKYFLSSLQNDLITLCIIGLSITMLFRSRQKGAFFLACGILVNMIYVLSVGGDFMQGRFLSFAFVAAVVASFMFVRIPVIAAGLGVLICFVYWGVYKESPISTPIGYSKEYYKAIDDYGVADERSFYFDSNSLWRYFDREKTRPFPSHPWANMGWKYSHSDQDVMFFKCIGMFGFWAGTEKVIVEPFGLVDPFLAWHPSLVPWRIGHFRRALPSGYMESIQSGRNQLQNPEDAHLYDLICLITKGPIFRMERWLAIYRMNIGLE